MIVLNQKYWCNAKLSYMDTDSFSPLRKIFEEQTKTNEDQENK